MATTIPTNTLSTVIGIFPSRDQADQAIDELRHTHFSYERIRLVEQGTGGFADTLRGLFTGQTSVASSSSDTLVKMGMPDYEAKYYQRELEAAHVLVLMNAEDRPEEAFDAMRQNGAFDINVRLRMTFMNDDSDEAADTMIDDSPDDIEDVSDMSEEDMSEEELSEEDIPEEAYHSNGVRR